TIDPLHSFPTRRSSDLFSKGSRGRQFSQSNFNSKIDSRDEYEHVRRVERGVQYDRCDQAGGSVGEGAKEQSEHEESDRSRPRVRSEEHTSELQSRSDLV